MNQVTFIDFLKSLITETITAVSETQLQQESKIIELKEDLLSSKEYLIEKYNLLEEAKLELEDKGGDEKAVYELLDFKVNSLRQVISTYFENGYVKPIVDKCKISANFLYNYNTDVTRLESKEIAEPKKLKSKKLHIPKNISVKDLKHTTRHLKISDKVFKLDDEKVNKISKNMKIQTIDLIKDKEVINSKQSLTSSVEIEFRTVIVK